MRKKIILITSGDQDGVGLEVTLKSLKKIGPQKSTLFVVFCSSLSPWPSPKDYLRAFRARFESESRPSKAAIDAAFDDNLDILVLLSPRNEALWVLDAIQYCLKKRRAVLVTGPVSKQRFHLAKLGAVGHTGLLKKLTGKKNLFMSFIGTHFSVVLATDHIPLSRVSKSINLRLLKIVSTHALNLRERFFNKNTPIYYLGINPHAGDGGLIGKEEQALKAIPFIGSDAAFTPGYLSKRPIYIAMYHDQGLIPFKAVHGFKTGVHMTLGLPFLRTSVDHGPAKDLYKKGKADFGSMHAAIMLALKIRK